MLHEEAKSLVDSEDLNDTMKLNIESDLSDVTEEWNQLIEHAKLLQEK